MNNLRPHSQLSAEVVLLGGLYSLKLAIQAVEDDLCAEVRLGAIALVHGEGDIGASAQANAAGFPGRNGCGCLVPKRIEFHESILRCRLLSLLRTVIRASLRWR